MNTEVKPPITKAKTITEQNKTPFDIVVEMVKTNPNDLELGIQIRKYISNLKHQ